MEQHNEYEAQSSKLLPYEPIVLVRDVVRCWALILAVAVVIGVAAYIITDRTYEPLYQSSATLVITSQDSNSTVYANLQSTTELASVFTGLLNSSILQNVILEEVGIQAVGYSISAAAISETNLLTLSVTARDPRTAFLVCRCLIEHHSIVTYEVVGDIVVEVLQAPVVASAPINSSNVPRAMLQAMGIAAVLACAGILAFSFTKDTVRSKAEAEKKLKCWCLGEIHHERKYRSFRDWITRRKSGLIITDPGNSFHYAETMRRLRRRVEQHMGDGKVLMVTSVMENEGKTTVSVNLAISLAKKHRRVLLIDLDLRKPACHRILNHNGFKRGMLDVLSGRATLDQAIITDQLSGLDVILERNITGKDNDQLAEMMSSPLFMEAIRQVREMYDYVVLDLPPLSAALDAEFVMDHADASLLVVQQNQVRASVLNRAVDTLQKGRAQLLGCVLNNVYTSHLPTRTGGYGYGYGRYNGYGRYAGADEQDRN